MIHRVSLGMTEEKLLEAVGPPISRSSAGETRTFEYRTWGCDPHGRPAHPEDWYVQLVNGKVSGYGRRTKARPDAADPAKPAV